MNTAKRQLTAWILCVFFVVSVCFSLLFLAKEAGHECTGADCSVCVCIHQAEQTLRRLVTCVVCAVIAATAYLFAGAAVRLQPSPALCVTPVLCKVRLNN